MTSCGHELTCHARQMHWTHSKFFPLLFAAWEKHVQSLTDRVKADLGVPDGQTVKAELYKLLLYQEGDHFAPHCDTEKAPGMFATMTVRSMRYVAQQHNTA